MVSLRKSQLGFIVLHQPPAPDFVGFIVSLRQGKVPHPGFRAHERLVQIVCMDQGWIHQCRKVISHRQDLSQFNTCGFDSVDVRNSNQATIDPCMTKKELKPYTILSPCLVFPIRSYIVKIDFHCSITEGSPQLLLIWSNSRLHCW